MLDSELVAKECFSLCPDPLEPIPASGTWCVVVDATTIEATFVAGTHERVLGLQLTDQDGNLYFLAISLAGGDQELSRSLFVGIERAYGKGYASIFHKSFY